MAELDQAARYAAKRLNAAGYLRELLGEKCWGLWRWRGWLDSQTIPFPGEPDRRLDTLAWFDRPDGASPPMALAVEFLARARSEVLPRLAEYCLRVHRELPFQEEPRVPYLVIGSVVNLTGSLSRNQWLMVPMDTNEVDWGDELEEGIAAHDPGNLGLMLNVGIRNLEKRSARRLLAHVADGSAARTLLAFLPLYAEAGQEEVAKEWAVQAGAEKDERNRADLAGLAGVFATHADRMNVWGPVLEKFDMEPSPWIEAFRNEGDLRTARAAVLDVLEIRFPGAVPAEVTEAIRQQTKVPLLRQSYQLAVTVKSPEEVRTFLQQAGK
jgi:hypothetical protein